MCSSDLHNNEHLKLFFLDRDTVYFKDRKLHADNFKFKVENSEITVNFLLDFLLFNRVFEVFPFAEMTGSDKFKFVQMLD